MDTNFRGAGVAVPVFSLRSEDSFGIGEYSDLKKLAEWAKATGQEIIQTLPVNDTTNSYTNQDSYPYSPISVFALHPVYINVCQTGMLKIIQPIILSIVAWRCCFLMFPQ